MIFHNLKRSTRFSGDDWTSRQHGFNDDSSEGLRRSRTMNHQIDSKKEGNDIATKPDEVNPVSHTQISGKLAYLLAKYAIFGREKGLSNN